VRFSSSCIDVSDNPQGHHDFSPRDLAMAPSRLPSVLALEIPLPWRSAANRRGPAQLKLAKKKQLSYATNGVGNITHVAGLLFDARTGTKMVAVPYNTPQLTTDVMTGTVDLTFFSVAAAAPLVNGGEIKALAVTGSRRSPSLPDTPTLQELG